MPPRDTTLEPIEDITRRRLLTAIPGLVLVAGGVACGDNDDDAAETATETPSAEADTGFPRTISHGVGETVIPARPTRIVTTADREQLEVVLAMGIKPVFYGRSGDYETVAPWVEAASVSGVESDAMPGPFEPDLERIALAEPDLIIDAWSDATGWEALSAIAPSVVIRVDENTPWQEVQRLTGEATGNEDAAEAAIAQTEAEIAAQGEQLADYRDRSVAVAFVSGGELVMLDGDRIGGRIFAALGMTVLPPPQEEPRRFSLERIGEILGDADIIVSFDYGELDAQEENALFRQLPAVQEGRYTSVPVEVASACYQESTLSLRWAAARVAGAIRRAAEGDGTILA